MVCWSHPQKKRDLLLPINSLEKDKDKKNYGETKLIKNLKQLIKIFLN